MPKEPIRDNPRSSSAKRKKGGRRPGAGAPRGNLNALKHGRNSKQFAQLGLLLAANPLTRDVLLDIARRLNLKQQGTLPATAELFSRLYNHAEDIAAGRDSPGPFRRHLRLKKQPPVHELNSIDQNSLKSPDAVPEAPEKNPNPPQVNQPPHTKPEFQSLPTNKTPID